MEQLPLHIQRAVRRYKPIETEGLTLYPVRVDEYDAFLAARPALEALQQSFPVRLMSVPILAAMYRMDFEAVVLEGKPGSGLFSSAVLGLVLALRLGEGLDIERRLKMVSPRADPKDPARLVALEWMLNGEELCRLTPVQYQRLRPILAAQNGVRLWSDEANPDLVQAEKDIGEASAVQLDVTVEGKVCAVATLTGAEETDIYDWPILKLEHRADALKRAMDYMVCGIGEASGTKWKTGNPAPHPFFERLRTESAAVTAIENFAGGAGARAAANPGMQTV